MPEKHGYGANQRPPRRPEPDYYDARDGLGVPDRHSQPGFGARRPPRRSQSGRSGSLPERWGSLPGRLGVFIVIGCALLGALGTVLTSGQPGMLLGVFLLAGTIMASFAVRRNMAHLVIPVPALAYPLAALASGFASNPGGSSRTALAIGAVQWIAHGFLPMLAATALAIGITATRRQRTATSAAASRGRRRARPAATSRDRSPHDATSSYDLPSRYDSASSYDRIRRHSQRRRRH